MAGGLYFRMVNHRFKDTDSAQNDIHPILSYQPLPFLNMKSNIQVGLVQDAPIFFDKTATIEKMLNHIKTASVKGVDLIIFPESYVPGYPRGFTFGTDIGRRTEEGKILYQQYWKNSVDLKGEETNQLVEASKTHGIYVVAGVTERTKTSGSLYCTTVYISPKKGLMGIHRKIKPTAAERIVWAEGDGSTLSTFQTEIGILGGLTCWENYMPAARMAMYQRGVQLYIAPTADARPAWVTSMQHIALEGRCYVLSCNQYVTRKDVPDRYLHHIHIENEVLCRGGSLVVSPDGNILAGPVYDQSEILLVNLDMNAIIRSKLDFDPNGHYTRPDIFELTISDLPPTFKEK
jgi:nitrilase